MYKNKHTMWKNHLKIKAAAEFLGVTALTLRNWDKTGKLPARRHPSNNYRVYKIADLEKFANKKNNDCKRIKMKLVDE